MNAERRHADGRRLDRAVGQLVVQPARQDRAVVVLPTPRTPVRIQACGMRPVSKAFEMVRTIASWPIRSSKVAGPVFAGEHPIAAPRPPESGGKRQIEAALAGQPGRLRSWEYRLRQGFSRRTTAGRLTGRRLTSDPNRSSLGLLPSGPDPVGEWLVHRQPPAPYIGASRGDCKLAATIRGGREPARIPPSAVWR